MTARLLSLPGLGRIVLVLAIAIVAARCAIVPETGRSQLVLMPTDYMNSMAVSAYAEETAAYPEITSGPPTVPEISTLPAAHLSHRPVRATPQVCPSVCAVLAPCSSPCRPCLASPDAPRLS